MRIRRLQISGFRGFAGHCDLDLDAEAVIILGANGQGKTSIFDAVLWGLTGEVPRIGSKHVISLYSESGGARVEIELVDPAGTIFTVTRSLGEGQDGLRLTIAGDVSEGIAAEAALLERLWPETGRTEDAISALTAATTRSVYLQQDLVREFIESEDERQRFLAMSELVGAGTVSELTVALDKAKAAWTGATNTQADALAERQVSMRASEARLESLAEPEVKIEGDLTEDWESWWRRAEELGVGEGELPEVDSPEAPRALEAAMRQLGALRAAASRRVLVVEELDERLRSESSEGPPAGQLEQLRTEATEAQEAEAQARRALGAVEEAAAEQRRHQVEAVEQLAEARALAEIAVRHLEGPCPVCGQDHDIEATRARLDEMIAASGPDEGGADPVDEIGALAERLRAAEAERIEAVERLGAAEVAARERGLAAENRRRQLAELGVEDGPEAAAKLARLAERQRSEAEALEAQIMAGERLGLELARVGERALRAELEGDVEAARAEVASLEAEVAARMRTRELAGRTLEELRETAAAVVSRRLEQIRPLLQRIYRTIDPHPSLRRIELTPEFSGRRGELTAMLSDPFEDKRVPQPDAVLSSSQLNALAVSIFLALNLGLPRLPLEMMMLDDPLQSLDDVNLLGVVDLLRRTKASRQMIVSTHDRRFSGLLTRKLRAMGSGGRTRLIELDGWSRRGPRVGQLDAPVDAKPLRIAA